MGHIVAKASCCALKCVNRVTMIQGLDGNNIDIHVALGVGKMLGLHVGGVAESWSYSTSLNSTTCYNRDGLFLLVYWQTH